MSYTKGPWRAVGTIVYFPEVRGGFDLRNCPDAEDNASICAAAPDLLEALEDMLSGWKYIRRTHGDLYVGWDRAQDKAEAAIAKAKGEGA